MGKDGYPQSQADVVVFFPIRDPEAKSSSFERLCSVRELDTRSRVGDSLLSRRGANPGCLRYRLSVSSDGGRPIGPLSI